ncbi:MAG: hypothetical protein V1689_10940 [Pseudomonadota bacterium]
MAGCWEKNGTKACQAFLQIVKPGQGTRDTLTIHLGNGASMAALKNGRCVDNQYGYDAPGRVGHGDPRSGDADPAIPFFLADQLGMYAFFEGSHMVGNDISPSLESTHYTLS